MYESALQHNSCMTLGKYLEPLERTSFLICNQGANLILMGANHENCFYQLTKGHNNLFFKITEFKKTCKLKYQAEWNILAWRIWVILTQRSSLNFQPGGKASDKGFPDTTFHIYLHLVVSKETDLESSYQLRPDENIFTNSLVCFEAILKQFF